MTKEIEKAYRKLELSKKELIDLIDKNFYESARKSTARISSNIANYEEPELKEIEKHTNSTQQE